MTKYTKKLLFISVIFAMIMLVYCEAFGVAPSKDNIITDINHNFRASALGYASALKDYALSLFLGLALIELIWSAVQLMFKINSADVADWFTMMFQKIIIISFYWWIVDNGLIVADFIYNTISSTLASKAMAENVGLGFTATSQLNPTDIMDMGLNFSFAMLDNVGWFSADGLSVMLAVFVILFLFVLIIAEIIIIQIEFLLVSAIGYFLLAFGALSFTREMVWNYFRSVGMIALKLFAIYMIVGIEFGFISEWLGDKSVAKAMAKDKQSVFVLIAALILFYLLVRSIPSKICQIVSSTMGGGGVGTSGGSAIKTVIAGAMGAAVGGYGGAQAVKAASDLAKTQAGGSSGGESTGSDSSGGESSGTSSPYSNTSSGSGSSSNNVPTLDSVGSESPGSESPGSGSSGSGSSGSGSSGSGSPGSKTKHIARTARNLGVHGAKAIMKKGDVGSVAISETVNSLKASNEEQQIMNDSYKPPTIDDI